MKKITIDGFEATVAPDTTILEAARRLGIDIPTLCHREGGPGENVSGRTFRESTSCTPTTCQVCLVKVDGRFVPACATRAENGMRIESETDEVRNLRRAALELLLGDHAGDCHAPCEFGCPARLDIPGMMRAIRDGDHDEAVRIVDERIPIPAILGRICPAPCEKLCRRKDFDGALMICRLKEYVGRKALESASRDTMNGDARKTPEKRDHPHAGEPFSIDAEWDGRSERGAVGIVGAGPTGLSAAYYLARFGYRVELYEKDSEAGGRLRSIDADRLPVELRNAEIDMILRRPGITFRPGEAVDWHLPGQGEIFRQRHDAVLLACGPISEDLLHQSDLDHGPGGLVVGAGTYSTSRPGIFAAGTLLRPKALVVRSVADGREAAEAIHSSLATSSLRAVAPIWSVRIKNLDADEWDAVLADGSSPAQVPRRDPDGERYTDAEAVEQARRCLHCECAGRADCRLLRYGRRYAAVTGDGRKRPRFRLIRSERIIHEPSKCIKCGLCIRITQERNEPVGLAFLGRGFHVRVGVPFGKNLTEGLGDSADACIEACPTAALRWA